MKVAGSNPDEVDFFNWPNSSSRTMALESTQPLTKWVPGIFLGGKGRPALRADKLTAICEPTVYTKYGSLDVSQPYRLSRSLTGIVLPFFILEISRSHAIYNFDMHCNNFSKIDNTWWWPYAAETCSEEEGWLDNKLHLSRKYLYTKKVYSPKYLQSISVSASHLQGIFTYSIISMVKP
jgi:hypothetical protein